ALSMRLLIHSEGLSRLETITVVSIIVGIIYIPLCLVAIALVSAIYQKQKSLVEQTRPVSRKKGSLLILNPCVPLRRV
ncbi:MAG: hypothetical protein RMJ35_05735, partial [Phycisphaerales bacterium]|nr:hypothetical protein [Phycisphaerales bacterium]